MRTKIFKPYTLEFPSWLWGTGFGKGTYHDRQSLGVTLPAGASISIRRASPIDTVLEMDLLNDAGLTETYIRITEAWTTLNVSVESVPFIRTPYVPVDVEIEYAVTGEKLLPIYTPEGSVALFFQQWDQSDSAFALIRTTYADLLVPALDKERVKALHQEEGLDSLEEYYTRVFEYFNALAGISFSTSVRTDRNIQNRYFIKADKTGGGFAYYGYSWTAQAAPSIEVCWLDTRHDNWCALHEIAHGYQTFAMCNSEIPTGEVWNNIYANCYQHKMMGQSVYERGWIYGGNAQGTFAAMRGRFESEVPASSGWHLHELLFLFMILIDKAGEPAFAAFNQYYRRLANSEGFSYLEFSLMNLLAACWAERENLDIAPVMDRVGVELSHERRLKNKYGNHVPISFLYRLVPDDQLVAIQQRLNLKTPLSLVDCKALKVTDLRGDLIISMDPETYNENESKMIVLRNGGNVSFPIKIVSPEFKLMGLPIGVYAIQSPFPLSGRKWANCNYVEVRANMENVMRLEYDCVSGTSLASQEVDLLGLGNGLFARISIDMRLQRAAVRVFTVSPHSYFGSTTYASIFVRDRNGFVIFELSIPGQGAVVSVDEFFVGSGCVVDVYHVEPSRFSSLPKHHGFIDSTTKNNFLEVTPQGFRNINLNNNPGDGLKAKIAESAEALRKDPHLLLHADYPLRGDIFFAIDTFGAPERNELLEQYRDLVVQYSDNGGPVLNGQYFTWGQLGNAQRVVANVSIDVGRSVVSVEVLPVKAHEYWPGVFIAIWVRTDKGEIIYSQELRGDAQAEASFVTLPFYESYTVSVCHREAVRTRLINVDTQESHQVKEIQVVRSAGLGKLQVL